MSVQYLDLADFLIIAEAVLGSPADQIALQTKLALADSALNAPAASFAGEEFYPDFPTKAAVLCAHLVKNHPLLDGNKRVALLATIEFCGRNGHAWRPPPGDEDGEVTADVIVDRYRSASVFFERPLGRTVVMTPLASAGDTAWPRGCTFSRKSSECGSSESEPA